MKKWCRRNTLGKTRERERGDVPRCSPVLFSALSNPHVKSFPALHRKLPAQGPTVTAYAGTSGNVGVVAWGGMRESASVLGGEGEGVDLGQLDSCGNPKAPTSTMLWDVCPKFTCCFRYSSAILSNPESREFVSNVKCEKTGCGDLLMNSILIVADLLESFIKLISFTMWWSHPIPAYLRLLFDPFPTHSSYNHLLPMSLWNIVARCFLSNFSIVVFLLQHVAY